MKVTPTVNDADILLEMRRWTFLLALGGCGFSVSADGNGNGNGIVDGGSDALRPDVATDPTCASMWTFSASNFDPCAQGTPQPALTLDAALWRFNATTGSLLRNGTMVMTLPLTGTNPRILSLEGLVVDMGAVVEITGDAPLIIGVHSTASINGRIDASAHGRSVGPGGDTCAGSDGSNATTVPAWSAGGGGGGGAFGSAGAAGGTGDTQDGTTNTPGGPAMSPAGGPTLAPLRAGCRGGTGGEEDPRANSAGTPGQGGGGGGALQITARTSLAIQASAQIAANGGGGGRGDNAPYIGPYHVGAGGGGGGSGGAILLESALVTLTPQSILCANGGAGGGGSHNNDANTDGSDGACATSAANGGTGSNANGGDGAFSSTAAQPGFPGTRQDDGGGGGGGGVGRIRVRSVSAAPGSFVSTPVAVTN